MWWGPNHLRLREPTLTEGTSFMLRVKNRQRLAISALALLAASSIAAPSNAVTASGPRVAVERASVEPSPGLYSWSRARQAGTGGLADGVELTVRRDRKVQFNYLFRSCGDDFINIVYKGSIKRQGLVEVKDSAATVTARGTEAGQKLLIQSRITWSSDTVAKGWLRASGGPCTGAKYTKKVFFRMTYEA